MDMGRVTKPRRDAEHLEQAALFRWVGFKIAQGDERYEQIYAIPNGGARSPVTGAKLKREGVKAGVADIAVDVAAGGYHGLKIEMKAGKNKPTKEQEQFLARAEKYGYKAAVCYSAEEAMQTITKYLG